MEKPEDFVNVSVRIRPYQRSEEPCVKVISDDPGILLHVDKQQTYQFDRIFRNDCKQEGIFHDTVKPLVAKVKEGFSCTVFAYGQTGTGKTYTMGTNPQKLDNTQTGLIPRTLVEFFSDGNSNSNLDISLSFIEIYNEKVFDLLGDDVNTALPISGFKVHGVKQERIFNSNEGMHFLEVGGKSRHTAETKQNTNSSRSHAVFTIHCTLNHSDGCKATSKLNLVDLAGCESVKKTGNQGSTFHEGVNINKGLLCIGQVMTALSHGNLSFIPYRQSVITSVLQDSLNRRNYVSLIVCVSSNADDSHETAQTLEFSQRVKKMKNKPEVNKIVSQYKEQNPILFERASINANIKTGVTPFKRTNSNMFQTPFASKRQKLVPPSQTIQEHNASGPLLESCKSLSMSLSSIMNVDSVQQTLSPMLKKYMVAMENSLMDKLQSVIENTIKRIPARSPRVNKENAPSLSWDTVQNEVSKLVRSEILQFTVKGTRATSSPIDKPICPRRLLTYDSPNTADENIIVMDDDGNNNFKIPEIPIMKSKNHSKRRSMRSAKKSNKGHNVCQVNVLSEDGQDYLCSPEAILDKNTSYQSFEDTILGLLGDSISETNASVAAVNDADCVFKLPKIPTRKRELVDKPLGIPAKRRSMRLSKKFSSNLCQSRMSCEDNEIDDEPFGIVAVKDKNQDLGKRQSIRRRKNSPNMVFDEDQPKKSARKVSTSPNQRSEEKKRISNKYMMSTEMDNSISPSTSPISNSRSVGRSKRISVRYATLNKTGHECVCTMSNMTPDKRKAKKQKSRKTGSVGKNKDSPITAHTRKVLSILNRGQRRDIEKLHTIGPKTADRILMFRKIKGNFRKISDLAEMPEWQTKRYRAFLSQNFLKDD